MGACQTKMTLMVKPSQKKEFTFYYFDMNARGDSIKMLLSHAKVKYIDKTI